MKRPGVVTTITQAAPEATRDAVAAATSTTNRLLSSYRRRRQCMRNLRCNVGCQYMYMSTLLVVFLLLLLPPQYAVHSQIVGTDICACQPATYQLILNLSLSCKDSTVNNTIPGIDEPACQIETTEGVQNIPNPYPVTIGSIIVSELDQNLDVVGQETYRGPFMTGQMINYTSIVITDPTSIDPTTIPRGFHVSLTGINAEELSLVNTWVITYDNDCGIFPLLTKGERIGWTIFGNLGNPPQEFCPVAPASPISAVGTSAPSVPSTTSLSGNEITLSPIIPLITPAPSPPPTSMIVPGLPTSASLKPSSMMKPTCPDIPINKKRKNAADDKNKDKNLQKRRLMTVGRPSSAPSSHCPENYDPQKKKNDSDTKGHDNYDRVDDTNKEYKKTTVGSREKDIPDDKHNNKKKKVPENRYDPTILDDLDDDLYYR